MIFVTVGTEGYPFNSLLEWIDVLIGYGIIDEEVVVQYGSSTKLPNGVKVYKSLPEKDFRLLIEKSRLVIAHCGEGTSLLLESLNKPYVLVPRLQKYNEHVDDHQLDLADTLEKRGVAIARSPGDLVDFLRTVDQNAKQNTMPISYRSAVQSIESELTHVATEFNSRERLNQDREMAKSSVLLAERPKQQDNSKLEIKLPELNPIAEHLRQQYAQTSRLMLVCSSGGHYKAMRELSAYYMSSPQISWVTFNNPTTNVELKASNVYWAHSPTNRNLPNLIRNFFLSFRVLWQEKPDIVLSTGAGVAVPFLILAKYLCGSRTIFVESKTRVRELSLSVKLLQACGAIDELIVQSPELSHCQPNATYIGEVTHEMTSN